MSEIKGYSDPTVTKVAKVNPNKVLEELVLRRIDELRTDPDVDQRLLSLAFTETQAAFMWLNRAIFKPERIKDLDLV